MFDIFFVDYKPGQTEEMAQALAKNPQVMFDYPMETSLESKSSILNLEKRIEILRKFKLENVEDPGDAGRTWLKFPQPPIEPVAEKASGLGFANIKKDEKWTQPKNAAGCKVNECRAVKRNGILSIH
ncbi:hypothetical protein LEP1GSC150_0470 [Leptospira interrogans serovar Copenhageni str. LT2050]|uniref:Uncharacterized protein n=1 Tax=Leptospira interrogans serovar Copenhageni str. LT2050 TaxID=1001598 RepID=M3IK56_LEPIT|nr:hypothetical protein LEP1GSC150_0470 [Leptospira interrogans serovar Copenhageni str. LT2050]